MSENLIFGKSVKQFGAVGDGKADDTEAFEKALESKENLLCVPYGTYKISKPLALHGNLRISCHKRARIDFVGASASVPSDNITVCGGIWNSVNTQDCAFDFTDASHVTLEHVTVNSASDCVVGFCSGRHLVVVDSYLTSGRTASGIVFGDKCGNIYLSNNKYSGCVAAIEFVPGAETDNLVAVTLDSDDCEMLVAANESQLTDCRFSHLSGHVSANALKISSCRLTEVCFSGVSVHDGYIRLDGNNYNNFNLRKLNRLSELEADTLKPSLEISGSDCTVICDGLSLDSMILAKKSIPDIKMTAARMAMPVPSVYSYTAEIPLNKNNSFTLPVGDIELLEVSDN